MRLHHIIVVSALSLSLFLGFAAGASAGRPANYRDELAKDEQAVLDRLAQQMQGEMLYTIDDSGQRDPLKRTWRVEKLVIGKWEPIQLGDGRYATWSPDGKQIAVVAFDNPVPATWNPGRAGAKLAYGSLYVMDADGRNRKKILTGVRDGAAGGIPITWHPSGKEIIFLKDTAEGPVDGLFVVDVTTGAVRELLPKLMSEAGIARGTPRCLADAEPQISADGRYLAARERESNGRLWWYDLQQQTKTAYGEGCCAGISPDGHWLSNNFDGHNRMTLHHRDGVQKLFATGKWDNPRWSNHNNYLSSTCDGWQGAQILDISGARWIQVISRKQSCDYPQLFITNAAQIPDLKVAVASDASSGYRSAQAWPGDTKDLAFCWADSSRPNFVPAGASGGTRACEVAMRGLACYGRGYVMQFSRDGAGSFVASGDAATVLLDACKRSNAFSLEVVVNSIPTPRGGLPRTGYLITFGGEKSPNFSFQRTPWGGLFLAVKTLHTPDPGDGILCSETDRSGGAAHVIVSCNANGVATYINGKLIGAQASLKPDFSNWEPGELVFGATPAGAQPWPMLLEGIAIYSRSIGPGEAAKKFELYNARLRAARKPVPAFQVTAKLVRTVAIPDPKTLTDYPRALVVHEYEVQGQPPAGLQHQNNRIQVAQWAILDSQILPSARDQTVGTVYRNMWLEPWEAHEEAHGERREELDGSALDLPMYSLVGREHVPLAPPAIIGTAADRP